MPFKKGTSGNSIGRPKGSVSTTTTTTTTSTTTTFTTTTNKLIREHISQAIDGNKI